MSKFLSISVALTQTAVISSLSYRSNDCDDGDEGCCETKCDRDDGIGGNGHCDWDALLVSILMYIGVFN
jgi:hypothetical protein